MHDSSFQVMILKSSISNEMVTRSGVSLYLFSAAAKMATGYLCNFFPNVKSQSRNVMARCSGFMSKVNDVDSSPRNVEVL